MLSIYGSYYYVPDNLLSILFVLTYLILTMIPWKIFYMTHFQKESLRQRKEKQLVQGYAISK